MEIPNPQDYADIAETVEVHPGDKFPRPSPARPQPQVEAPSVSRRAGRSGVNRGPQSSSPFGAIMNREHSTLQA
jgi:hypothetical protein